MTAIFASCGNEENQEPCYATKVTPSVQMVRYQAPRPLYNLNRVLKEASSLPMSHSPAVMYKIDTSHNL